MILFMIRDGQFVLLPQIALFVVLSALAVGLVVRFVGGFRRPTDTWLEQM